VTQAEVSPAFVDAVRWALDQAKHNPDEVVRFAAHYIPIYAQRTPTQEQAEAGGCPTCTYLGLWADRWPGYDAAPHGTVWLFEDGIKRMGGDVRKQALGTLLHEIDHALQRDHVLEALQAAKADIAAAAIRPQFGCCAR
jgi:hypothetical protein